MPQRDSCASGLARACLPRRGASRKLRLQAFPMPAAGRPTIWPHPHTRVCGGVPSGAFLAHLAYRLHRAMPGNSRRPAAGPGWWHEVKRRAAFGSAAISRADNQLTSRLCVSLDIRQNAKFSSARMARACAPQVGGGELARLSAAASGRTWRAWSNRTSAVQ